MRESSSARDSYWSTDPLRLDEAQSDALFAWWQRHSLRASAPGALLPDVFVRRVRNSIEISWGSLRTPGIPTDVRFLALRNRALLAPKPTAQVLYESLGLAIASIAEKAQVEPRVTSLAKAHASLKLAPDMRSRAAWMTGWPKKKLNSWIDGLLPTLAALALPASEPLIISRPTVPLAMYGSLSPELDEKDVQALTTLLEQSVSPPPGDGDDLFEPQYEPVAAEPWNQGYELAQRARELLHTGPDRADIIATLDDLGVRRRELSLSDENVRAVAISGDGIHPVVAINGSCLYNQTEPGRRFTLAHELCHLMFDREQGVPLAVASGPWAPADIEKRANAFASEFLLPSDWARRLFGDYAEAGRLSKQGLIEISQAAGLGKVATLRHLQNIGLIDPEQTALLEDALTYPDPV